jgi:lipid II:glycine glycyltransferase (peptidoglycan interpeptide bridge formation enzyme)
MTTLSAAAWDEFLQDYPEAHLLQTGAWGALKARFGWQAEHIQSGEAGAQVLFRTLPLGLSIAYIPKGPVGRDWSALLPELHRICRKRKALLLKVEPDAWEGEMDNIAARLPDFQDGGDPIQPRRTVILSLAGEEADWLARMKQKTRYNIRLAEKKDVTVRLSDDVSAFYRLMQQTGARDGFGVHSQAYFQSAYELFAPAGMAALLLAEYAGRPLAGLMVFARGRRAWYFYGASNDEERNRMPAYLLQWEAMRWAKARGCQEYDLWGVPDADEDTLEANFSDRSDGLWGVYRFKRGFGGTLVRSAGAWERAYLPLAAPAYHWWTRRRREAA